jgi:hypothetical protein
MCKGVARQAKLVLPTVPAGDRGVLLAAAYLHDLGYAPGLVQTELHPPDGARHLRAAGLAPLRPHDLRHTAVALWIAAGANPKEVSVRAGHTSVSFTYDRYGHLFPGHDDALRDRLDAMHAEGLRGAAGGAVVELPAAPSRPQRGPRRSKNKEGPARHRA